MTTTNALQALLIGALLSASTALADSSIQVSASNGRQEARFSLGDSKCMLVDDAIVCTPVLIASK